MLLSIDEQSQLSDEAFVKLAFDAVGREFGVSGLARFLHLTQPNDGDYTRDRHSWLGNAQPESQMIPDTQPQAALSPAVR